MARPCRVEAPRAVSALVIRFDHVTKVFGSGPTTVRAVSDVSFEIPSGAFWSVMGPSGSGKTSLLHLIAGITHPSSGHVFVDGIDVAALGREQTAELRRRKVGYVFQAFNLLSYLSVERNVAMPLVLDGAKAQVVRERVARMLKLLGLEGRRHHTASELSGGEQQRVAIARALVIEPSVLLADEPTGNLDTSASQAILELISRMNSELGVTVLLVTHDPVCTAYAQYALRLVDGRVTQTIPMDDPVDPAKLGPMRVGSS